MNRNKTTARSAKGFTLIELLVVMAIIAVLAGLTLAVLNVANRTQTRQVTKTAVAGMTTALERYHSDWGEYPPTQSGDGSKVLYQAISGDGSSLLKDGGSDSDGEIDDNAQNYLEAMDAVNNPMGLVDPTTYNVIDAWGNPFHYRRYDEENEEQTFNQTFDLGSYGSNGKGEDDMTPPNANPEWITNWTR